MNCWLIVNTFMESEKFKNLYKLLFDAFDKRGVSLTIKRAQDISLEVGKEIKEKPEFAIFWDKDIYLAERLEAQGIRLFNSSRAINLCDNKILMYQELIKHQIRIPRTLVAPKTFEGLGYKDLAFVKEAGKELGWPLVIKEAYGSFGEQVYLANDMDEAEKIITAIGYHDFLMQEFIASSKGKDVRINVIGEQVIASMLRENKNDFRSNISNGGKGVNFSPNQDYIDLAIKAVKALGLDFAGVDVLFGEDGPIICEVNSNPQFASTLSATGINLADFIADYILRQVC
ncbi:MAG: RimK family alpha-L-glutamate ligase [Bacilli bacterium]|nr:RimK family alpha-L-glutamate ligase [Bacilli bacterium]